MSKSKGTKFSNRAARRFSDVSKVDTMSQDEIFDILSEDLKVMLDQMTAFRDHVPGATYPSYISNAFANISTPLFFLEFVKDHCKEKKKNHKLKTDLDPDEVESMKTILADAYKKSATNAYDKQLQEFTDRNKLLSKAFVRLDPKTYHRTKKLDGLSKSQRRDLTVQVYGDPTYAMKQVHKLINQSTTRDGKKLKILKKLYGDRFDRAVGAAMTIEGNNSDCLSMLFEYVAAKPKHKRAKYLLMYAEAYKRNKNRYFRVDDAFLAKNKKAIKKLIKIDRGYRKAFRTLTPATGGIKNKNKNSNKYR